MLQGTGPSPSPSPNPSEPDTGWAELLLGARIPLVKKSDGAPGLSPRQVPLALFRDWAPERSLGPVPVLAPAASWKQVEQSHTLEQGCTVTLASGPCVSPPTLQHPGFSGCPSLVSCEDPLPPLEPATPGPTLGCYHL